MPNDPSYQPLFIDGDELLLEKPSTHTPQKSLPSTESHTAIKKAPSDRIRYFQWKTFFSSLFATAILLYAWSSTSDLFEVPQDVQVAYKTYLEAKRRYFLHQNYWDSKREHFEKLIKHDFENQRNVNAMLLLETLTPEILISFLASNLKISEERLNTFSLMQKENSTACTLILSKAEQAIWPFKIIVSLEMDIALADEGIALAFTRLRRGAEDISTSLALAYFGSDLEMLKPLPIISMKASAPSPH